MSMCYYDKGTLLRVERNPKYRQSWTIVTKKGRHYTNSPRVAEKCQKLIGKNIELDIMRYGRVIGVREKGKDNLQISQFVKNG